MEACVGCVLAVDCGKDEYYQGKLAAVHTEENYTGITLTSAFKNGVPFGKSVKLESSKITEIKVLVMAPTSSFDNASTASMPPPVTKEKKKPKENKPQPRVLQRSKSTSSAQVLKPVNNSNSSTTKWVSRPVPNGLKCVPAESGFSSDDESSSQLSGDQGMKQRMSSKGKKHKTVQNGVVAEPPLVTATPHFKRFEPQIPKPQQLTAPAWAIKSSKKGRGPCGIPMLDVQNGYGPIGKRDAHLDKPIDFDLLATDFDFSTNLQDFDKDHIEEDDQQFFETVEKAKMSQNFAHDENILSDPKRITSWTTVTSKNCYSSTESIESHEPRSSDSPVMMSFCPSDFVQIPNGSRVPVLDEVIKNKYLESCRSHLGSSGFSFVVADRLLMYLVEISNIISPGSHSIVILSEHDDSKTARLIAQRLVDRGHTVSLFGNVDCTPVSKLNKISSVKQLPSNPHVVLVLSKFVGNETSEWLKQRKEAHVLAVESRPEVADYNKLHILMLGTLSSGLNIAPAAPLVLGRTSFAALAGAPTPTKIDCRVADIGVPFSWIVDGGTEALSKFFSSGPLISLQ